MKAAYYTGNRVILNRQSHEIIFNKIYRLNAWGDIETLSGAGSNTLNTAAIRKALPSLLRNFGIGSLLDIPCGDFFWMNQISLGVDRYIGADIVKKLVDANREKFATTGRAFVMMDILVDDLPSVDLIICRDCLPHFSFADIGRALSQIKKSGSRYLLTSTYTSRIENTDIATGGFRPLNLQIVPFNFPPPLAIINEECRFDNDIYEDKSLGLWEIKNLPS